MSTEANKAVLAFLCACKDNGLKAEDVRKAFCVVFNIREADEQLEKHAEALADALEDLLERGDGEFRYCCWTPYRAPHAEYCQVHKVSDAFRDFQKESA